MSLVGASLILPSATSRTWVGRPYSLARGAKKGRGQLGLEFEYAASSEPGTYRSRMQHWHVFRIREHVLQISYESDRDE